MEPMRQACLSLYNSLILRRDAEKETLQRWLGTLSLPASKRMDAINKIATFDQYRILDVQTSESWPLIERLFPSSVPE
jgi:hypothetical protein